MIDEKITGPVWPASEPYATPEAIARYYLAQASRDMCWLADPAQSNDPKDMAIRAGRVAAFTYLARMLIELDRWAPKRARGWSRRIWQSADAGDLLGDDIGDGMRLVGMDVEAHIAAYEQAGRDLAAADGGEYTP